MSLKNSFFQYSSLNGLYWKNQRIISGERFYKCTEHLQAPNIYHVKQEASDIKDEDFAKAAEEYKAKKEQERLTPRTTVSSSPASAERERVRVGGYV